MSQLGEKIQNVSTNEDLINLLSVPYSEDVEFARRYLEGNIMILGAGGELGLTLTKRIIQAIDQAATDTTVYAVSRFSEPDIESRLQSWGAETISANLLEEGSLDSLPDCKNIIYMVGMKFGTSDQRPKTWAVNTYLPGQVARRFKNSRIVVFSTDNVYPPVLVDSGGSRETDDTGPIGEYAQSCLGRERVFQFFARRNETPICLLRLNYAVEFRYGVLVDIANRVYEGDPVPLDVGYLNAVWQGDVNSMCFRSLKHTTVPAEILNLTGTDIYSVRQLAERFADEFGCEVIFEGEERDTALLNDASKCHELYGDPKVSADEIIPAVASWLENGGQTLGKPTKFHVRDGAF